MMVVVIFPEFSSGLPPASDCWELPDAGWVKELVSAVPSAGVHMGPVCGSWTFEFQSELQPYFSLEREVTQTWSGDGCDYSTALCTNWFSQCLPLPSLQRPLSSSPWGTWEVLCFWTLLLNWKRWEGAEQSWLRGIWVAGEGLWLHYPSSAWDRSAMVLSLGPLGQHGDKAGHNGCG